MKKIFVYGKDARSKRLKEMYKIEGKLAKDVEEAEILVCPMPLSRDNKYIDTENITINELIKLSKNKKIFSGAISYQIKEELNKQNIEYIDMLELDEVAILNSIPTAEGAIAAAMEITDFTLHGSNCLVMGYGNIGKVLAKMLSGVGANVFCEARKEKDLANIETMRYNCIRLEEISKYLGKMDVIFNTIPHVILNEDNLRSLKKNCVIIDLASKPGGVDFEAAKKLGINVIWALSLPGKVAPYSAAKYLKNTIDKNM